MPILIWRRSGVFGVAGVSAGDGIRFGFDPDEVNGVPGVLELDVLTGVVGVCRLEINCCRWTGSDLKTSQSVIINPWWNICE